MWNDGFASKKQRTKGFTAIRFAIRLALGTQTIMRTRLCSVKNELTRLGDVKMFTSFEKLKIKMENSQINEDNNPVGGGFEAVR